MATINSTVLSASNLTQDLFTIEERLTNVFQFVAGPSTAVATFDTVETNIDTDASFDGTTGQLTLSSTTTTYLITVTLDNTSKAPSSFRIEETSTGIQVGLARDAGQTLTATVTPGESKVYQTVVYTNDGTLFQYPSQVKNASITVQAVSGYENA